MRVKIARNGGVSIPDVQASQFSSFPNIITLRNPNNNNNKSLCRVKKVEDHSCISLQLHTECFVHSAAILSGSRVEFEPRINFRNPLASKPAGPIRSFDVRERRGDRERWSGAGALAKSRSTTRGEIVQGPREPDNYDGRRFPRNFAVDPSSGRNQGNGGVSAADNCCSRADCRKPER